MGISRIYWLVLSLAFLSAFSGCSGSSSTSSSAKDEMHATNEDNEMESEITTALAELSAEDRAAATAQKFCVVEQENLLGSMGAPVKLMIEGQPVFLCCEGCKDAALKDPQAILAALVKLKEINSVK